MPVITAILTVEQRNALVMQAVSSISAARRAAKDTEDSSSRAGCLAHIALLQSARTALDDGTRGSAWQQLKDAKARITELENLLRGAVPHVRACAEHDEQAVLAEVRKRVYSVVRSRFSAVADALFGGHLRACWLR